MGLQVLKFLKERVISSKDPKKFGKPLRHEKWGLWRYRVGIIRIIVSIQEEEMIVLIVRVGKRDHIYG